jgi:hypothetical protein
MYIDADIDDELRTEAFDTRTSKNDLLRKYLRLGKRSPDSAGSKRSSQNRGMRARAKLRENLGQRP